MLKGQAFKIIFGALVCFLFILIFGMITGNHIINNAFSFIFTPIQELSNSVFDNMKNSLPVSKTEQEYKKIIDSKEEELVKIRSSLIEYENVKKENEQYKKIYNHKEETKDFKFILASIISRDPDENFYGFFINKGSASGMSVNDPVITASGLIGWIETIRPTSSYVKTILSADSKIGAVCKENNEDGVITGSLKLADKNITKMMFLKPKSELKEGDMLVTSGICGMFPKDLLIGKVKGGIKNDESPYVEIEPYEDIHKLTDVFVVVDFFGKGEMNY